MKFVAVVFAIFVSVSTVFADDVVWQVAPPFSLVPRGGGQEIGKTPKDHMTDSDEEKAQAQNSQQNAENVPLVKTEPSTSTDKGSNQQSSGDINPDKVTKNGGESPYFILWVIGVIVTIVVGVVATIYYICVSFFNFYQARQTKKKNILDEEYRERTERIMRIKDRALLTLAKWELSPHNAKKEQTKDDDELDTIRCVLLNIGGSSATLGNSYCDRWVVNEKPALPDFRKKLSSKLKGKIVVKGEPFPLSLEQLNTVDRKAVDRRQKAIYIFVYLEYTDPFRGEYEECSLMRYHVDEGFTSMELPKGTCKN